MGAHALGRVTVEFVEEREHAPVEGTACLKRTWTTSRRLVRRKRGQSARRR